MTPADTEPTIDVLSGALQGLQSSSPELLEAVHRAVVPMRTVAEKRQELARFLAAGQTTFGTMAEAFENNTDQLTVITRELSPVLGVMADGGGEFAPMVTRINDVGNRFLTEVWKADSNTAVGKFLLVITPNRMYTRADCPRYRHLEAPSCQTAPPTAEEPALMPVLDPGSYPFPAAGGHAGPLPSPVEREQLSELLGPEGNPAFELLLGPVVSGNTVQVVPAPPDPAPPAGGAQRNLTLSPEVGP
jgi:hypothetical protein